MITLFSLPLASYSSTTTQNGKAFIELCYDRLGIFFLFAALFFPEQDTSQPGIVKNTNHPFQIIIGNHIFNQAQYPQTPYQDQEVCIHPVFV